MKDCYPSGAPIITMVLRSSLVLMEVAEGGSHR